MPLRDRDAVIVALVTVLCVHVFIYALLPHGAPRPRRVEMPKPERLVVKLLPVPEADEQREAEYLRANPEAPVEEPPPDVVDYSNRDQVAAQEEVTPLSEDNMPAQEGDEEDSNRLVQGSPFQPPPTPAQAPSSQQPAQQPTPLQMPAPKDTVQTPPPLVRDDIPEDPEGLLAREDPPEDPEIVEDPDPDPAPDKPPQTSPLDGQGMAQTFSPQQPGQPPSTQREPLPRPTVQARENSFGPLRSSFLGVSRTGRVAFSTRYTEFGEYWNRVLEIIERKWNDLVWNSYDAITWNRDRVRFEITIRRDGTITNLDVLYSGVGRVEETLASDAIMSRSPFPEWTPDMIATVGEETTFELGFIY